MLPAAVLWADVEGSRLDDALLSIPSLKDTVGYLGTFSDPTTVQSAQSCRATALRAAADMWQAAVARVQADGWDDRPLYWQRLALRRALEESECDKTGVEAIFPALERTSRGFEAIRFPATPAESNLRKVLITGFDPFFLDRDITQSNPSGLAALALDGLLIEAVDSQRDVGAHVEGVLMPVRFEDFDRGMIEAFIGPYVREHRVDLIVTISMGRDRFDLERFPGRRRSAAAPDNRNVLTGASAAQPLIPALAGELLAGPEFVEFSLPAAAMAAVEGHWQVRDNRWVTTLQHGSFEATNLAELVDETAVQGSGGGYLSNEISYRSVLLARQSGSAVRIGHLHTPAVRGYDREVEREIVLQIRRILLAALAAL